MKILLISLCLVLAGCVTSNKALDDQLSYLYESAPSKGSLIYDYLGQDEQALEEIRVPMQTFQILVDQLDANDQPLYEFVKDNQRHTFQLVAAWDELKAAIATYSKRSGTIIPPELSAFRAEIESTYDALIKQARARDKAATVAKYAELILQIIAAKNGIIV